MSKTSEQAIDSIDPTALAAVTGGATANEQVMTVLRSVVTSIKDLATSRSGSNDSITQIMPMMMMMMMRGGQSAPAQVAAAPACQCQSGGNGWIKVR